MIRTDIPLTVQIANAAKILGAIGILIIIAISICIFQHQKKKTETGVSWEELQKIAEEDMRNLQKPLTNTYLSKKP